MQWPLECVYSSWQSWSITHRIEEFNSIEDRRSAEKGLLAHLNAVEGYTYISNKQRDGSGTYICSQHRARQENGSETNGRSIKRQRVSKEEWKCGGSVNIAYGKARKLKMNISLAQKHEKPQVSTRLGATEIDTIQKLADSGLYPFQISIQMQSIFGIQV